MKKVIFFILFAGTVFKLKAQQNTITNLLEKSASTKTSFPIDSVTNLSSSKPKNNLNLLFSLKQQSSFLITNNLTAELDRMPIVKPVGKWNMPIVKPDRIIYTTPIKRLPPVVKPQPEIQKLNP